MNDYRKLWEYVTKTKLPKQFVIHHLNLKHEDSRIGNIIPLTVSTHSELHNIIRHTKTKVDLYYSILNLKFERPYILYMRKIDKNLTSKTIKEILLRGVGIPLHSSIPSRLF